MHTNIIGWRADLGPDERLGQALDRLRDGLLRASQQERNMLRCSDDERWELLRRVAMRVLEELPQACESESAA